MNTSGGAVIMGSFPHPPNGIVELDYEYILLFKKPGPPPKVDAARKAASELTKEEWKQFFAGHWNFGGVRQTNHEAMFPEELPRRLIRMFSFVGETVLDPFLGSGTTAKVAVELGRSAIGYEVNPEFIPLIRAKVGEAENLLSSYSTHFEEAPSLPTEALLAYPNDYTPQIEDANPIRNPNQFRFEKDATYRVRDIVDERTLRMDTDLTVTLLGLKVSSSQAERTRRYLERYLRGKQVILRFDTVSNGTDTNIPIPAYVQLSNKLFVNRKMIEMGLAQADRTLPHKFRDKFIAAEESAAAPIHHA